MSRCRRRAAALAVLAAVAAPAGAQRGVNATISAEVRANQLVIRDGFALAPAALCPNMVEQAFPLTGPEQTRWRICWRITPGTDGRSSQLVLGPVSFRKAPGAAFIKLFHDARVAEIHVPYYLGEQRYLDIAEHNFAMEELNPDECPASAGGTLVGASLCVERHDRGVTWRAGYAPIGRRGQEVVLWAALDADNYSYIQSYAFRDDGVVIGRVGATGENIGGSMEPHAHNAVWRLDIDLGGASNEVEVRRHVETMSANSTGSTTVTPVKTAGKFDWNPQAFTTLGVRNAGLKNARGLTTSYHLTPIIESGLSRHSEPFTKADFWVTPYDATHQTATDLPQYVAGAPLVQNRDLVVWVKNTALHHPRTEDGVTSDGYWIGTTHAMWSGFMMMPHDLFDCTPFYEQPCPTG